MAKQIKHTGIRRREILNEEGGKRRCEIRDHLSTITTDEGQRIALWWRLHDVCKPPVHSSPTAVKE